MTWHTHAVRTGLAWLVSLPAMALGSLAGHGLAYDLVTPGSVALQSSGHGYLEYAPAFVAICGSVALAALAAQAIGACRGGPTPAGVPWLVGVLPPVAFALQEYGERLVHDGTWPTATVMEPVFLVGLAIQVPFGVAALALARLLLRAADRLGRALAGRPPRRPRRTSAAAVSPVSDRPVPATVGRANRGRAPPVLAG